MKKFLSLVTLAALSLGFSSCCSMFGMPASGAGYRTETKQVKTCGYDIVTEEVRTDDGSKYGLVETVEKKVPRYYCPKKDCCGTTSESVMKMATSQGPTGSPYIGLIPTMRKLAE